MKIEQVGAQLYSIRDYTQTPKDVAESMKKIKKIGFETVQVSGMGPIDENELIKILDGEGLRCIATHESADDILDNPQKCVERLSKLNCKYTAYPYPTNIKLDSFDDVIKFAKRLNESGKYFFEADQVLMYHNHNIEFQKFNNEIILDTIYSKTDSQYLQGELDTYWVQAGGGSLIEWINKLNNRLPIIHLKDYGVNSEKTNVIKELGNGNINWKDIVSASEETGTEWFIIEQDNNWINNDPFEALKISFEYLKENICS